MIAFKSRKSSIRRRCIELLRTINMQGVFDSWYLASFAQLVADLEEKRAREITCKPEGVDLEASEVPEAARFVEIELSPVNYTEHRQSFYKGDMGRLCYVYKDEAGRLLADQAMFKVERPPDLPVTKPWDITRGRCCGLWKDYDLVSVARYEASLRHLQSQMQSFLYSSAQFARYKRHEEVQSSSPLERTSARNSQYLYPPSTQDSMLAAHLSLVPS
ncbi:hypothetical protein AC578_7262 [Pseudocercospora eumusae]|nr:hypothetical protein AC578_7262 [Pseudocercospora eumusae]